MPDFLTRLRELEAKATKGPWTAVELCPTDGTITEYVAKTIELGERAEYFAVRCESNPSGRFDVCHTGNGPTSPENAALISLLRNAAPEIAALVEAVEADPYCLGQFDPGDPRCGKCAGCRTFAALAALRGKG